MPVSREEQLIYRDRVGGEEKSGNLLVAAALPGTDEQQVRWDSTTERFEAFTPAAAGGAGTILGLARRDPGSADTFTAGTGAGLTDVHADLAVTFTAPASGIVLVVVEAVCESSATVQGRWGVRESSTDLDDTLVILGAQGPRRTHYTTRISGVTAGAHTYKWGHRSFNEGFYTYAGENYGPAIMQVLEGL